MRRALATFLAVLGVQLATGAFWAFLNGTFPSDTATPHTVVFNLAAVFLLGAAAGMFHFAKLAWDSGVRASMARETNPEA